MTQTARRDLLRECNDKQAPLDEFQTGFCGRCINPECTRSLFGQSRFDLRVNTWEDRLFKDVPRMDAHDPRYNAISGQKFITIDTGRTPEIRSDWADPRDLQAKEPSAPTSVVETSSEASVQPAPAPVQHPSRVPAHLLRANTMPQTGIMVGGKPAPAAQPPRDPWAGPEPAKDPVVPVGSRVRMGGSGV